jgi:hypothetical protein
VLNRPHFSERLPKTQRNPLLLAWWLKVNRRFDSPIYLFGCEETFSSFSALRTSRAK